MGMPVTDDGIGIRPENLMRIFSHGFATKKDAHGFGLDLFALAAQEMGGSMTLHRDDSGRGAAFMPEMPCTPNQDLN